MHGFKMQRLPMQLGAINRAVSALEFPSEDCRKIFIVAQRFAVGGLVFLSEMGAA